MLIQRTIFINASNKVVWDWLTEFEKLSTWNPTLLKEELISNGEPRAGFKSRILIREGKKEIWYDNEILEYRPYSLLRVSLEGGHLGKSPMTVDHALYEEGQGVRLEYESNWKPMGFMLKLLYPLISIMANKNATKCLEDLKSCIESA